MFGILGILREDGMTGSLLALTVALLGAPQEADLREEIRRLQETIRRQQETIERQQEALDRLARRVDGMESTGTVPAGHAAAPQEGTQEGPQGPYSRGFLSRFGRNAYLGGYIDLEYINRRYRELGRAARDTRPGSTFDQHRLVPLISADISDRIKFWSEIEIEHGEQLGVEFAHVDFLAKDWLNFRGGLILLPFRYNLYHDSPMQELTARPATVEFISSTVLRDPGVGLFGRIDLGQGESFLDYELYVTNGFKGLDATGVSRINGITGLRNARPHRSGGNFGDSYRDFNDNKALTGRIQWTPALGLELGAVGHVGDYDERGDNALRLYSFDLALEGGALVNLFGAPEGEMNAFQKWLFKSRFVAQVDYADLERDAFAKAAGIPDDLTGWYAEYNFRFMPQFVRDLLGPLAGEDATLTFTTRYDYVRMSRREQEMLTVGLNIRPIPRTVIKFDYQFDLDDANEGFLFSIATYF